ncbi:hypothetical protein U14_05270 [Candidatus Moduliflexus flocculans]|uniref:DUF3298 domain-containing protein n=1 Tax=Candidatus Moduliflexus flocculans TaxID=1499966 RepID=A0A081BRG2_9BACT|nr:hypothetical protein U14_05270 [Candidatus Moduliflexus flocculans]
MRQRDVYYHLAIVSIALFAMSPVYSSAEEENYYDVFSPMTNYCKTPPNSKQLFIGQIENTEEIAVILDSHNTGYFELMACLTPKTRCQYGRGSIKITKKEASKITLQVYGEDTENNTDEESQSEPQIVSTFSGRMEQEGEQFVGTWYSNSTPQGIPFLLWKVAEYSLAGRIEGQAFYRVQTTRHFTDEQRVSEIVRSGLVSSRSCVNENEEESYETDYRLYYDSPLFLSMYYAFHRWYAGGPAHGELSSRAYNVLFSSTGLREVTLWELLDEKEAVDILSNACIKGLQTQEARDVVEGTFTAFSKEFFNDFAIHPHGVTIIFAPEVVSSYQAGWFDVTIPFEQLKQVLNYNHPIVKQLLAK